MAPRDVARFRGVTLLWCTSTPWNRLRTSTLAPVTHTVHRGTASDPRLMGVVWNQGGRARDRSRLSVRGRHRRRTPWARRGPASARYIAGDLDYSMREVDRDVMATLESNHRVALRAESLLVCRLRHVATAIV